MPRRCVSIPFIAGQWSLHAYSFIKVWRRQYVSIPFIAGQWSLQRGFARARRSGRRVSIPFIAGQWSLHYFIHTPIVMPDGFQSPSLRGSGRFWDRDLVTAEILRFQSPSLRGSGRFARAAAGGGGARWSFNPLHCGAVVASKARCSWARARAWFQSPSLRGSGRFSCRDGDADRRRARFNPLHCGAVVASGGRGDP